MADNHNYMCIVQKNFQIWTLIQQLLTKCHFFTKFKRISHIHKPLIFKSIIGIFLDQLLPLYKFYGREMSFTKKFNKPFMRGFPKEAIIVKTLFSHKEKNKKWTKNNSLLPKIEQTLMQVLHYWIYTYR